MKLKLKTCRKCGKNYNPNHPHNLYCSVKCGDLARGESIRKYTAKQKEKSK